MTYEYSQTILFVLETFEVIAEIQDNDYNTEIRFLDSKKAQEFYSICESWGILVPYLRIKDDILTYGSSQSGTKAYEYYQYMCLIISYLHNDFKLKELK